MALQISTGVTDGELASNEPETNQKMQTTGSKC